MAMTLLELNKLHKKIATEMLHEAQREALRKEMEKLDRRLKAIERAIGLDKAKRNLPGWF